MSKRVVHIRGLLLVPYIFFCATLKADHYSLKITHNFMDESNQEGDAIAADAPHVVDVEAKPAVDAPAYASMTFDERLAGYNAENEATLKKYGIVLGAEAYIVDGLIRSRPVAVPIEQSTLKANG